MRTKPISLHVGSRWYAAAALALLGAGHAQGASATYFISVNTSSVTGTLGFLDLQFNPGNNTSQAATATITNFQGGGLGAPQNTGNVSGTLPASLTLVNSTPLNEVFQAFTYGSSFSFVLTLSGPALDTPNGTATAGTTFGLGLYDNTQNPILTNQTLLTGFALQIDIGLNGTAASTAFPTATNGPSVANVQAIVSSSTIPTLSEWGMVLFGMLLCGWGALSLRKVHSLALDPGDVSRNGDL